MLWNFATAAFQAGSFFKFDPGSSPWVMELIVSLKALYPLTYPNTHPVNAADAEEFSRLDSVQVPQEAFPGPSTTASLMLAEAVISEAAKKITALHAIDMPNLINFTPDVSESAASGPELSCEAPLPSWHRLGLSNPSGMLPCQLFASFGRRNRDRNAIMRAAGGSIGAIARALRRTKSTVLRELLRNALPQNLVAVTPAVGRETRALR